MTAPALPGAAPDPAPGRNDAARLPPEVEKALMAFARTTTLTPESVEAVAALRAAIMDAMRAAHRAEVERVARDAVLRALHVERNEGLSKTTKEVVDDAVAAAMRAATAGSGAASAASAASARALGGDGEPVAWGLLNWHGKLDTRPYFAAKDAERHRVVEESMGRTLRVVPLYTRPAATGDTVGAAARALVKAAIDARADEAVTGIIVPEAEWDALLAALRSTPGGGACG